MCWGCRGRFDALSSSRWRVGICAQQRSNFLLLRQKKVTKEKASRRQGRSAVPCAARTARGLAKLASLGQRQPLSERRSAAQPCLNGGEFKHPNIPAARVGAVPRRYEEASSAEAGGSGLLGSDTNFAAALCAAPGGRAEGSANLGSDPKNRASFCAPRPNRATQRTGAAGRRIRLAFLLGTFLWRSKEKYLARRGETRLATW